MTIDIKEMGRTDPVQVVAKFEATATKHNQPCEGGHIVWRSWGSPQYEPLVLFHGGHGSWTHWIRNIDELSKTRNVWVPDLPGFGESSAIPGALDADSVHPAMGEALKEIFPNRPVDVVGFSFGGMVGSFVAANFPEQVKTLTLVGAPGLGITQGPLEGLIGVKHLTDAAEIENAHRHNLSVLMLANPDSIDALALYLQTNNVAADRLPRRRMSQTDVVVQLQTKWKCPVFGIWGRKDRLYEGKIDLIKGALSKCDLRELVLIDGAGHWVQYEKSEEFNATLKRLIG